MPSRSLAAVLLLLAACTEYNIDEKDDNNEIPDGDTNVECPPQIPDCRDSDPPDSDPPDSDPPEETCEDFYLAAETVPLQEECYVEEQTGTFTPVVEYRKSTWSVDPSSNNIMMMPAVASLTDDNGDGLINEDDIPDIIVITYGGAGTLRAVSGDGSAEIFNVTNQSLQGQGAVAVGDIDNDGIVEIIAPTSNTLKAFEHDGTLKWTSAPLSGHMYGTSDAPAIHDMDGDGNPEIIVGRAILDNNGSLIGAGSYGIGGVGSNVGTTSFAADIDLDGDLEVVVGNAAYDINGTALFNNGQADGYVALGDFDLDGLPEIVVNSSGRIRVQDNTGTVVWSYSLSNSGSYYGGPPTVADFDGDGYPEVGVAARSTYTVIDTDGSLLWERTTQDASSGNTGSSVFDFEGDGIAEAVYADETRLWVFSGPDGTVKLESTEHSNATWTEYPVVADVDADGVAEIVVPNTNYSGHTGFYVFGDADGSWREGRRIWNQHAYYITNVNDDGTIPAYPDPNWERYNNFRSGDLTAGTGGTFPDLIVSLDEMCDVFCDDGRLFVWGRVGNQGYLEVDPGTELSLWAVTPQGRQFMATTTITSPIGPGEMLESVQFEVAGIGDWDIRNLVLTVDGGNNAEGQGDISECNEENNEDELGYQPCL
ncbi:MAG: VCBS repeat-containing protein [Alphaproteobacteria bacterium]|nr:VCBS repeat-containing protein [Alphaproteobacteria bacterium]MCB9795657.1 VCBS repeat-containing protein [Alphaproteobacteria bacterium]